MSALRIRPLSVGRFLALEKSNFTYGMNQGVKIQTPVLMWFIEGAGKNILVDSGCSDPEWASRYHHPLERKTHEEPIKAIEGLGLKPEDIDIVVNTHLLIALPVLKEGTSIACYQKTSTFKFHQHSLYPRGMSGHG